MPPVGAVWSCSEPGGGPERREDQQGRDGSTVAVSWGLRFRMLGHPFLHGWHRWAPGSLGSQAQSQVDLGTARIDNVPSLGTSPNDKENDVLLNNVAQNKIWTLCLECLGMRGASQTWVPTAPSSFQFHLGQLRCEFLLHLGCPAPLCPWEPPDRGTGLPRKERPAQSTGIQHF